MGWRLYFSWLNFLKISQPILVTLGSECRPELAYNRYVLTLFLDTASNSHSLALCTEKELLRRVPLQTHGDTDLVPAIENILREKNFTYKDLTNLVSVIGPGGFTSLRVGVTAINTLAYALDLPSSGVHLSDMWAGRVRGRVGDPSEPEPAPQTPFLWLHSTRRTQIFVKGFGENGTITPIGIFELEDAAKLQGAYIGELIPEHQALLSGCTKILEAELKPIEKFLPEFWCTH